MIHYIYDTKVSAKVLISCVERTSNRCYFLLFSLAPAKKTYWSNVGVVGDLLESTNLCETDKRVPLLARSTFLSDVGPLVRPGTLICQYVEKKNFYFSDTQLVTNETPTSFLSLALWYKGLRS